MRCSKSNENPRRSNIKSNAGRVKQFHNAVGSNDPSVPTQPDGTVLALRRALIEEESREVRDAFILHAASLEEDKEISFGTLVHELVDLLYVTYGALVAFGVEPDEVFAEVQRANMQKVSGPRRADGKQLKPKDWQPADVASVIVVQKQRQR